MKIFFVSSEKSKQRPRWRGRPMAGLEAHVSALKARGREQGVVYDPGKGRVSFLLVSMGGLVAQEFSSHTGGAAFPSCLTLCCLLLLILLTNFKRAS